MFGLFESDEKKVRRLFGEFQECYTKIAGMSMQNQHATTITLGTIISETERSIKHPLKCGGDDAKFMAE